MQIKRATFTLSPTLNLCCSTLKISPATMIISIHYDQFITCFDTLWCTRQSADILKPKIGDILCPSTINSLIRISNPLKHNNECVRFVVGTEKYVSVINFISSIRRTYFILVPHNWLFLARKIWHPIRH